MFTGKINQNIIITIFKDNEVYKTLTFNPTNNNEFKNIDEAEKFLKNYLIKLNSQNKNENIENEITPIYIEILSTENEIIKENEKYIIDINKNFNIKITLYNDEILKIDKLNNIQNKNIILIFKNILNNEKEIFYISSDKLLIDNNYIVIQNINFSKKGIYEFDIDKMIEINEIDNEIFKDDIDINQLINKIKIIIK